MKVRLWGTGAVCALTLVLAVTLVTLPAAAQMTNPDRTVSSPTSDVKSNTALTGGDVIYGAGLTAAELQRLGYTQPQIAELQSSARSEQAAGTSNAGETSAAGRSPEATSANKAETSGTEERTQTAETNQPTASTGGGGGWGLWGLVGLLGLLGLGGGRRKEVVHRPEERDVRRVA
ncbi:MAG: hypothetical protein ACE14M_13725 [Terriglobales bacterium]